MAFGIKTINPIDTRPGTAIGVSIPFNGPTGFNSTYTTKEAIKNNLINYFLTNVGERYENPTFGANLRQYIFEQITQDSFDNIEEDLQARVATQIPGVSIIEVEVTRFEGQADYNTILITIRYDITGTGLTDSLQIAFT